MEFELRGWETTGIVDDRGHFKLIKHHLVRFAFHGISDADLRQFTPDTILFELRFSRPDEYEAASKFVVTLNSAMGSDRSGPCPRSSAKS